MRLSSQSVADSLLVLAIVALRSAEVAFAAVGVVVTFMRRTTPSRVTQVPPAIRDKDRVAVQMRAVERLRMAASLPLRSCSAV